MQSEPAPRKWKICLINGLAQNARHWNPHLLETLRHRDWVDDVLAFDLPGAGRLSRQRSPTQIPEYIPLMRRFYEQELATDNPRLLDRAQPGRHGGERVVPPISRRLPETRPGKHQFRQVRRLLQTSSTRRLVHVCVDLLRPQSHARRTLRARSRIEPSRETSRHASRLDRSPTPISHRAPQCIRQLIAAKRYVAPQRLPQNRRSLLTSRSTLPLHRRRNDRQSLRRLIGRGTQTDDRPRVSRRRCQELTAILESCVDVDMAGHNNTRSLIAAANKSHHALIAINGLLWLAWLAYWYVSALVCWRVANTPKAA